MNFLYESGRIYIENDSKEFIGEVLFPEVRSGVVNITSTFVSEEYSGQGIAGKLIAELVNHLKKENLTAIATCSYAKNWFEKNPQHGELLVKQGDI